MESEPVQEYKIIPRLKIQKTQIRSFKGRVTWITEWMPNSFKFVLALWNGQFDHSLWYRESIYLLFITIL